jgi:hypothetical protein
MDDLDYYIREDMHVANSRKMERQKKRHKKKREQYLRDLKRKKHAQKRHIPFAWREIDGCVLLYIQEFLRARNPVGYKEKRTSEIVAYCQNKYHRFAVDVTYDDTVLIMRTSVRTVKQDPADLVKTFFRQDCRVTPEDPTMFDQIADLLELANANYWLGDFIGTHTMQFGGILPLVHQQMREVVPVRLVPRAGESPERLEYWKFTGIVRDGVLFWETADKSIVHQRRVERLLNSSPDVALTVNKLLDWKRADQRMRRRREQKRFHQNVR